jgi:hypothetical protein
MAQRASVRVGLTFEFDAKHPGERHVTPKVLLVGSRADDESLLLSAHVEKTIWWEDYQSDWHLLLDSDQGLRISVDGDTWQVSNIDLLHVRYPNSESAKLSSAVLLLENLVSPSSLSAAPPAKRPLNKPSQLAGLVDYRHPRTQITNRAELICPTLQGGIVKSIGLVRSTAFRIDLGQKIQLSMPTLVQEYIEGFEVKNHVRTLKNKVIAMPIEIRSDEADYRYSQDSYLRHEPAHQQKLNLLSKHLAKVYSAKLFDFDLRITPCGQSYFLEFNSSPTFACFEWKTRESSILSQYFLSPSTTAVVGGKQDRCLNRIYLSPDSPGRLLRLALENIESTWNPIVFQSQLFIHHKKQLYAVEQMYYRASSSESPKLRKAMEQFNNLSDLGGEDFIGNQSTQFLNGSKLRQTVITKQCLGPGTISMPDSWVRKGGVAKAAIEQLPDSIIVKSLSSTRSIVVDRPVFETWDTEAELSIPTLFQQLVKGADLRIHVLPKSLHGKKVESKSEVDYRYAKERHFIDYPTEAAVANDLQKVREAEGSKFIGVDLIDRDGKLYFLESNPGPAWEWFYNSDDVAIDRAIGDELKHA